MIRKLLIAMLSATIVGSAAGVVACSPERLSGTDDVGGPQHFVKPDNLLNSYLDYKLNDDGKGYTVIGIGQETGETVVIPATYKNGEFSEEELPVTAIAAEAFTPKDENDGTRNITNFTVNTNDRGNYNLKEIGDGAFAGCTALKSITLPDEVTLGTGVFASCKGLAVVNLGRSMITIPDSTFMNCTAIASINIPSSIQTIGESAFDGCSGLTSLTLGAGVRTIKRRAFADCTRLTELSTTTARYLDSIGERAFYGCTNLRKVVIDNNSIREIGFACFQKCSKLESITVPFVGYKKYNSREAFNAATDNGGSLYENFTEEVEGGPNIVQSYCTTSFGYIFGAKSVSENNTVQWLGRFIPITLTHVKIVGGYGIAQDALMYCYSIKNLDIQNVEFLGTHCFAYCHFNSIVIGKAVNTIKQDIIANGDASIVYYGGTDATTPADWGKINIDKSSGDKNENITNENKRYYYSVSRASKSWHYINDVPTIWNA